MNLPFILASASKERLRLLNVIGVKVEQIISTDIDETPLKKERAKDLALRLAIAKAKAAEAKIPEGYILAADTTVEVGRNILPKALSNNDVTYCLKALSGSRHRVYTGICFIKKEKKNIIIRQKLCCSIVKFKRLSDQDIDFYLSSNQGIGKAGAYGIFGAAESLVEKIMGTYSNVAGLPLLETRNMLLSIGFNNFNFEKV